MGRPEPGDSNTYLKYSEKVDVPLGEGGLTIGVGGDEKRNRRGATSGEMKNTIGLVGMDRGDRGISKIIHR